MGHNGPQEPLRGYYSSRERQKCGCYGSSPRARGTPRRRRRGAGRARFIPACAGNTRPCRQLPVQMAVHPRVRGEHTLPGRQAWLSVRFIPACAGNTTQGYLDLRCIAVHPRMRGEHEYRPRSIFALHGSSPHARGTRNEHHHVRPRLRFIPACAGNTKTPLCSTNSAPVHPRVRGEHAGFHERHVPAVRFIPACAGNTSHTEHGLISSRGSSLRARGTRSGRGFGH